jgi:hypothetical protein
MKVKALINALQFTEGPVNLTHCNHSKKTFMWLAASVTKGSQPPFSAPAHQPGTEVSGQGRLSGRSCLWPATLKCLLFDVVMKRWHLCTPIYRQLKYLQIAL